MLVRNVGHLMTDAGVPDRDGRDVPEGILDAAITSLIALHDLKRGGAARNSRSRFDLCRQAEDARPARRWRSPIDLFAAVEDCSACAAIRSSSASWMKNGGRPSTSRHASTRSSPRRLHQYRLPRPHRRRDPHRHGGGADGPQGRHARSDPGSRPTRTGTSISAWPADFPVMRRSARACGRCPI